VTGSVRDRLAEIVELIDHLDDEARREAIRDLDEEVRRFCAWWTSHHHQPIAQAATHATLTVQGDNEMADITVDTVGATAVLAFLDDHGNAAVVPNGPDGNPAVIAFASDDEGVLTVAIDPANPYQGDLTPVVAGSANISVTVNDATSGTPVLLADGVTPIAPAAQDVIVAAGAATSATLTVNV
jgi:hypothetical protein